MTIFYREGSVAIAIVRDEDSQEQIDGHARPCVWPESYSRDQYRLKLIIAKTDDRNKLN